MNIVNFYNQIFTILFLLMAGGAIVLEFWRKKPEVPKEPVPSPDAKEPSKQALRRTDGAEKESSKQVLRRTDGAERILFIVLMLLALFLRLWRFGEVPAGMNQDGAMAAVDAKALADYATDRFGTFLPTHFKAWGYGQMSVLLSYCMVPFIKLFGLSAITARLPMLLFSMAGLAALFFLGKRLLGARGGLIVLTLGATNPWHFMQSRWALDCNLFPHLFLLGLFFLLKALDGKKRYLACSMIAFALCMYSYGIAFYTVPVFLLFLSIWLLARKLLDWRSVLLSGLLYFAISWPIYLTMMINAFGWKTIRTFFCTMPYFEGSVRSRDLIFFSDHKLAQLQANLKSLTGVYLNGDGLPWNTIQGHGVLWKCFLPFVFLGIFACLRKLIREKDQKVRAGYVAVLAYYVIANLSGLITAQVNVNRINILHYSLILFAAFGICFTAERIGRMSWVVGAAYLILSVLFLRTYFTEHADSLRWYYFADYVEAVSFAGEQEGCTRYVITPYVRGEYARNSSEILTMFALSVDAEVFQGKRLNENGLTYQEMITYADASQRVANPGEPVVYVMRKEDVLSQSWDQYALYAYGNYYVAVPEVFAK